MPLCNDASLGPLAVCGGHYPPRNRRQRPRPYRVHGAGSSGACQNRRNRLATGRVPARDGWKGATAKLMASKALRRFRYLPNWISLRPPPEAALFSFDLLWFKSARAFEGVIGAVPDRV